MAALIHEQSCSEEAGLAVCLFYAAPDGAAGKQGNVSALCFRARKNESERER